MPLLVSTRAIFSTPVSEVPSFLVQPTFMRGGGSCDVPCLQTIGPRFRPAAGVVERYESITSKPRRQCSFRVVVQGERAHECYQCKQRVDVDINDGLLAERAVTGIPCCTCNQDCLGDIICSEGGDTAPIVTVQNFFNVTPAAGEKLSQWRIQTAEIEAGLARRSTFWHNGSGGAM